MKKLNAKKIINLVLGAILVALGVIYILNTLGVTDITFSFDGWWTLFIIIPSACGLFTSKEKVGSLIGLAIGVVLLLCARDVIEFSMIWNILVPVVIVIVGIKLITKTISKDEDDDSDDDDKEDE